MLSAFRSVLETLGILPSESRVLVAVSGGPDSMCMANLFFESGVEFSIAHCNFHLRGEESDGDEALVTDWAEARDIMIHRKDFDTLSFAENNGISVEMAARELRYSWFAGLCAEYGYGFLAVAHNANDNAETLFLNLVRGTGVKGLSGMGQVSEIPYADGRTGAVLVRPLLSFTRKQIEGYIFDRKIPCREDSTNSDVKFRRNRIRHTVFPILEDINPVFIKSVSREMKYFSMAESVLETYCEDALKRMTGGDGMSLDLKGLLSERHWEYILYVYMSSFGFNSSAVASVTRLLKDGKATLSGKRFRSLTHELLTAHDRILVRQLNDSPGKDSGPLEVACDGQYEYAGVRFSTETLQRSEIESLKQPEGILLFDAGCLKYPFLCRKWEAGDWFRPLGSRGRKKVSDFFTDMKYDGFRKESAVMIVDPSLADANEKHISSVLGVRADDMYKVTDRTLEVLKITVL